MSNLPLISVIMPAYNAEKYLSQAVESILTQTFQDFELILINDASTDSTAKIMEEYALKDSRILVKNNPTNLNIAESRNSGVALAKGEYIATMDADDISLPNRLRDQLNYLSGHPNISICIGNIKVIDEKGELKYSREYPASDSELKARVFRYNPFPNPTIMCKSEVYKIIGKYDNAFVPIDDFDFWLRSGTKFKFGNCNQYILKYRIVSGSASHGKIKKTERLTFKLRKKAMELGYKPTVFDVLFNIAHLISFLVLPPSIKIKLFNLLRQMKIIS